MKRSSVLFSVTAMVAIGGCKLDDGDFGGSTPTAENVALAVPASGTTQGALTAGDGTTRSALLGQQADSYTLTRAVTSNRSRPPCSATKLSPRSSVLSRP